MYIPLCIQACTPLLVKTVSLCESFNGSHFETLNFDEEKTRLTFSEYGDHVITLKRSSLRLSI